MTNSEARKRHQAAQAPVSRPNAAPVDSGANGRLNERQTVDALLACLPMHEDGTGHVADCGFDWDATVSCGCYTLPERLAAIVREHAERAWDEGVAWTGLNVTFAKTSNPYRRAARQEQGR